jgi:hypothetical protein
MDIIDDVCNKFQTYLTSHNITLTSLSTSPIYEEINHSDIDINLTLTAESGAGCSESKEDTYHHETHDESDEDTPLIKF